MSQGYLATEAELLELHELSGLVTCTLAMCMFFGSLSVSCLLSALLLEQYLLFWACALGAVTAAFGFDLNRSFRKRRSELIQRIRERPAS